MIQRQKTDRDMIDSLMKDKVIESKKNTVMTDRERTIIIIMMSTDHTVIDIIIVRLMEPEEQLMILMREEDTGRGEMNPAEDHIETSPGTFPEMSLVEDPIETSPGTFQGIDIDREDTLREVAAKKAEREATRKMKIGRPTMVKGDSERVARSP